MRAIEMIHERTHEKVTKLRGRDYTQDYDNRDLLYKFEKIKLY